MTIEQERAFADLAKAIQAERKIRAESADATKLANELQDKVGQAVNYTTRCHDRIKQLAGLPDAAEPVTVEPIPVPAAKPALPQGGSGTAKPTKR